uniref:RNA-directed DNA polymerase n=1 Tax=Rhipicephalus microplus TaxID=6941 RepID=A0A6G5ABK3_RHIMP
MPKSLRAALLRSSHDEPMAGHLSGSKVFAKLSRVVTWPGMKRDIFRYCRSCRVCQTVKSRGGKPPGLMKPIVSERPWQVATCDLMGPFPRSKQGFIHLMVVVDHFSKWVEFFPLRKVTARAMLEKLQEVFCRFGFPERLITDNASYFTARVFSVTCRFLGINHCTTSPYHLQSNLTERVNQTLKLMFAAFAESQRDWADHLSESHSLFEHGSLAQLVSRQPS